MKLIFPETRHLGLQFEHKNEAIPIRIEKDMIFQNELEELIRIEKDMIFQNELEELLYELREKPRF